jgi:hypothetical protein
LPLRRKDLFGRAFHPLMPWLIRQTVDEIHVGYTEINEVSRFVSWLTKKIRSAFASRPTILEKEYL